ncbi:aldehyde dehydrogenase family 16 member A1-like [Littorina saxatilis]|uniref:Aldehyde dehydrogenase domain-containing protein n=1 Tax=Littorina saxatilis TaxID=31220 RepID=A0AAN9BLL6_9CAEN
MAATSARASANNVQTIFENMNYGPAADTDNVAKAWLDDHKRQFGHFINNEWCKSENGTPCQAHNPATGELLATVIDATESDVEKASKAAKAAFQTWSKLSDNARARHLYSITRHVQKHQQLFSVVETLDTGRVMRESRDIEVPQAVRLLYHYTGSAQLCSTELQGYKPYGVVAVLPSFARPLVSMVQRVAVALATGNTVVICPSPATPLSALLFAEVCKEAGLPAGVINVVTDGRECGGMHKLVLREEVDKVAYAGTTREGQMVRQLMAGRGTSLSLELSGRSPMVVFDTADLDSVVEGVVDAGWGYAGQLNTSVSRLLVQESVEKSLTQKLCKRLQNVKVGNSLEKNQDVGALAGEGLQLDLVRQLVEEAKQEGAQVFQASTENCTRGTFYPPTLVVGAQTASRIVYEDVQGPVVCLIPFRTAKEAIAIANNSTLAMAASVWTENVSLAMEVTAGLQAGTVWINSHNTVDAAAGFGGAKQSGSGRVGSRRGLLEYVQPSWAQREAPGAQGLNLHTFGSTVGPRPSDAAAVGGASGDSPAIDQTHKLYYGGVQKRPDGQYSRPVLTSDGKVMGQVSEATRKDVRNAVEAAGKAVAGWSKRPGHNKAQILYYIAENMELQKNNLAECIEVMTGQAKGQGQKEVELALERLFFWAAYCDKYGGSVQEVPMYGTVFETNESVGIIGVACPDAQPLLSFVSLFAAAISRGNAVIMIPSEKHPLAAIQLYQVFDTSDLPGGVVNILTGNKDHLTRVLSEHHDVQAVWYFGSAEGSKFVEHAAAENVKRTWVNNGHERDFATPCQGQGEEFLFQSTQPKTVWIPMGEIFAN